MGVVNVTVIKECTELVKDYLEQDKEFKKSINFIREFFFKKNSKPHPLTNFEIMNYFKNETRFNGVYSRDNLPKTIENGAYVINLDEKNRYWHTLGCFVYKI